MESAARLLRLLSLLQTRPGWTSSDLAEKMAVTTRTIRRDVTRLRDLGYPVDAETGPHGGYTIRAGASLPPLLLDDDEAVAVAIGLRGAAAGSVDGIEDAALGAPSPSSRPCCRRGCGTASKPSTPPPPTSPATSRRSPRPCS